MTNTKSKFVVLFRWSCLRLTDDSAKWKHSLETDTINGMPSQTRDMSYLSFILIQPLCGAQDAQPSSKDTKQHGKRIEGFDPSDVGLASPNICFQALIEEIITAGDTPRSDFTSPAPQH
jgi:hypothetical protein